MHIYLIRHGETTGDLERRYGGDYDDHLTDEGKEQSQEVADKLINRGIEKLFASPKIRAQETAEAIAAKLGLTVNTIEDFRERNRYGILTGMTKTDAREAYPRQVELLNDEHSTPDGSEPYSQFQARIKAALQALGNNDYQTIAVVTHGGPLKFVFRELLNYGEINVGDCSYVQLEANHEAYEIKELSGISLN